MAYICNLILRTLATTQQEIDSEPRQIVSDLPRPKRDDIRPGPKIPPTRIAAHDPHLYV